MRFLLLWCILICASGFGSTRTKNNFTSAIENEFIVVLKPQASILSFKAFDGGGGEVIRPLGIINGMLVKMDKSKTLQVLKDPSVAYIEPNKRMYALSEQSNPPWGLDRIDSKKGLDSKYVYSKTGAGVNVYVVDTGIRASHSEFSGRVRQGFESV